MRSSLPLVALLVSGCTTSVSTLQTARTLDPGKVEFVAGGSVPIHGPFVSSFADMIDSAGERVTTGNSTAMTPEEERRAIKAVLAGVLFQPAVIPEVHGRVGLVEGVDVGLRYAGPSFKLDGKVQLAAREFYSLAFTAGYVHHTGLGASIAEKAFDVFESMKLADYSRRDVDLALLLSGREDRTFNAYGALRYLLGMPSFQVSVPRELAASGTGAEQESSPKMHYFGGTCGMRLGGRTIGFLAELSAMYVVFRPEVLSEVRDMSGVLIQPAMGLDVRF
jgi:hypothetical protein